MRTKDKDTIYWTRDYNIFKKTVHNRMVFNDDHLVESIQKHGFRASCAIHVMRNPDWKVGAKYNKFIVKDGHRRLSYAEKLKVPVAYIVETEDIDIYDLQGTQKAWSLKNWLQARAKHHHPEIEKFEKWYEPTALPLGFALSMMNCAGRGSVSQHLKDGTFKMGNPEKADRLVRLLNGLKEAGVEFAKSTNFCTAMRWAMATPGFEAAHFLKQVRMRPSMLEHCVTVDLYIDSIDAAYNYHRQAGRLAIKHNAGEAKRAHERVNRTNVKQEVRKVAKVK
jgi:hypothetical protein